ncbi:MAG: hypothetical protein JMDDDDMK_04813 [Acidobacteria bacterium]|nr:hypothetical protein [Acidobacteriota bacterium]
MLFSAEDQREVVISRAQLAAQIERRVDGLLLFDARAVGCADDQVAIADGFIEQLNYARVGQNVFGVDG